MIREIYLAGGCFWGTEHFIKMLPGIVETQVGYANSLTPDPTYKEVCSGKTNAAETVLVKYDEDKIALSFILKMFFMTIDPISINKQGNDVGAQYRTGIYFTDSTDMSIIQLALRDLQKKYNKPLAIEHTALDNFYAAEDYHQDYLDQNPGGYCHVRPELFKEAKGAQCPPSLIEADRKMRESVKGTSSSVADLRQRLTPIQYHVTMENGTEPAFQNEYWDNNREGIYVDIVTGKPLFSSLDKFQSTCGWPAFSKPIAGNVLYDKMDKSHGMIRTEVRSKVGDIHLGHVFNDGPIERGGLRYCINSAALRFIPRDSLKIKGYGEYEKLFTSSNPKK